MSYSSSSCTQLTRTLINNTNNENSNSNLTDNADISCLELNDLNNLVDTNYISKSKQNNDDSNKSQTNNQDSDLKPTQIYNCNNNTNTSFKSKSNATREIETLTDICSSDNIAEVDVISLLDENIPKYKLRADTIFSHSNCDWIRAPLYIDEQQISELTNEQILFTLDYFILSGNRVSQMTKTYYDIEAVTKLLDEKERDLELAATIGKQLLEKDQQLELKIEILEQELEKATEMVNQLRYEISLKDNLLKSFIDSEEEILFDSHNEVVNHRKQSDFDSETLNDYKRKITYLENENDSLRNKAEYFQKETADLETKESVLIEHCFKELETTQSILRTTQDELQTKTTECISQQEEINHLFSQIFELQLRIKNLTQDNTDLHSVYESSKADLLEQIKELKEKYMECLQLLSKSQEEISQLRKKSNSNSKRSTLCKSTSTSLYQNQTPQSLMNSIDSSSLGYFDEEGNELDSSCTYKPSGILSSKLPLQAPNENSLAAEMFSSIAKDYRSKHSNLPFQTSQSSEFIKKVKQKLTKQLPGSNIESCLQSDSELELVLNSSSIEQQQQQQQQQQFLLNKQAPYLAKFTNCPTPDSILSTGSASLYSNIFARSNSFLLPEKLQIVKPIEGSQTLQHWQYLATPNLGCLFESRPGISIKGNHSDSDKNSENKAIEDDDGGVYDDFEDEYDYDYDENEDELDLVSYFQNLNDSLSENAEQESLNFKQASRALSPSKVELLSKLLENEEKKQSYETNSNTNNKNSILDFFKNISNKYFKSNSLELNNKKSQSEFDDPDTPPSSPINDPMNNKSGQNIFEFAKLKLVDSLSSYFKPAPTPPGTPNNGLELEDLDSSSSSEDSIESESKNNFLDQIVAKLSLFTFKSVANTEKTDVLTSNQSVILKPSAIYPKPRSSSANNFENENDSEIERIQTEAEKKKTNSKLCNTPPPSPSKFSPPLPDLECHSYTEEDMKKSAFVKVTSLNPYINQTVDLASLLGSVSSLKRSQRLYYKS